MAHFLNLYSPETYRRYLASDRTLTGFRQRQATTAARIAPGDILIGYLTKLSRWVALQRVVSTAFSDETSDLFGAGSPYVIHFRVEPIVTLAPEMGVPIRDQACWEGLSFTRNVDRASSQWTGRVRCSLTRFDPLDGEFLADLLHRQATSPVSHPLSVRDEALLRSHQAQRVEGPVPVEVPLDHEAEEVTAEPGEARRSVQVQAMLAKLGAEMGLRIWLPRHDRGAVLTEWPEGASALLESLPLNYDETTIRTIEQIDVLWLRNRSIVRAFEVEHTTSIYSGILRMADLRALQPNMSIRLHLVAPAARRDKVFQEIRRPVFQLLDAGPLADTCTYLSYEAVEELVALPHLGHMSDGVVEEYDEPAE